MSADPPGDAAPTRRFTVGATLLGLGLLAVAVLVWPAASLSERTVQARAEAATGRDAVDAARRQASEADDARRDALDAEREAQQAGEQATEAAAGLSLARDRAEQAEQAVLLALAASFAAADDVVGAQNAAVEQGNRGDASGEQALITGRAVPAVDDYRDALAAAETALAELRAAVVALQRELS